MKKFLLDWRNRDTKPQKKHFSVIVIEMNSTVQDTGNKSLELTAREMRKRSRQRVTEWDSCGAIMTRAEMRKRERKRQRIRVEDRLEELEDQLDTMEDVMAELVALLHEQKNVLNLIQERQETLLRANTTG